MREGDHRTTIVCYNDTHGLGWHHVDLFVHDTAGRELDWVHWQVGADGPEAADDVTGAVEPNLKRTSAWRHGVGPSGVEYWEADAVWGDT